MKIRTQLLLACFVLSVLPLTGIVVYSYRSSRRALEDAYKREAKRLTAQMDRRLGAVQAQLDQSLAALSVLPLNGLNEKVSDNTTQPEVARNEAMENMGKSCETVAWRPATQRRRDLRSRKSARLAARSALH